MKFAPLGAVVAALGFWAPTPSDAGDWSAVYIVSGAIGGGKQSVSGGGASADSETGVEARVDFGALIGRDWVALAELSYASHEYDLNPVDQEARRIAGFLVGQYRLPVGGYLRPYLELGVGASHFTSATDHDVSLGVKGGVGLDMAVSERTSVFVEGHYARFFDVVDVDVDETSAAVGVSYRFE